MPPFLSCCCFSFLFYCLLHLRSGNLFSYFANFFISFFLIFVVSIQFSPFISMASFKFIIICSSFSWISTPFSSFLISFSSSSPFSSSSYPNYTIACDDFLNIPWHFPPFLLLLLFIPLLFFLPFLIQRSLVLFFSFLLRSFSSHSSSFLHVVSISTQFSSFISFAWYKFSINMLVLCSSSSSVSSSISTSSFLFLLFFFISQCDDFLSFPCHFLGAVLPAPALYPSLVNVQAKYKSKMHKCI